MNFLYSAALIVFATSVALPSWSAKIIKTIDGGIICPNVPEEQTMPLARDLSYLLFNMAGKEISPIAITVAPTIPVVAASNAPTKITDMPNPPGIGPKSWPIVTNKSSAILERCNIIPIKMNNGIAIRVSPSTSQ